MHKQGYNAGSAAAKQLENLIAAGFRFAGNFRIAQYCRGRGKSRATLRVHCTFAAGYTFLVCLHGPAEKAQGEELGLGYFPGPGLVPFNQLTVSSITFLISLFSVSEGVTTTFFSLIVVENRGSSWCWM